jgi:hypothetical protein
MNLNNITLLPELFVGLSLAEQQEQMLPLGYWNPEQLIRFSRRINGFSSPVYGDRLNYLEATHISGPIQVKSPHLSLHWESGADNLIWAGPESDRSIYAIDEDCLGKVNRYDSAKLGSITYQKIAYFPASGKSCYMVQFR